MQTKHHIQERDFFQQPFQRNEIEKLLAGNPASEMFSFKSPSFKNLGLQRDHLDDHALIELMLAQPRLIRRPIVQIGSKIYFGADVKRLTEILSS